MRRCVLLLLALLSACSGGSDNPPAAADDASPPEITLLGENPQYVEAATVYTELGASALDDADGDLTDEIKIDASAIDTGAPGEYSVTYSVSDESGNVATAVRTVIVEDTEPPIITLLGDDPQLFLTGSMYTEAGATAEDSLDGDLTDSLVVDAGAVDTGTVGEYPVTYNVTDAAGNAAATVTRTVRVENPPPPSAPSVSVEGDIRQLIFSWAAAEGVDHYRLFENADGQSGFTQVGDDVPASELTVTRDIAVHLLDWSGVEYRVDACNPGGCTPSEVVTVTDLMLDTIGYFKASNAEMNDAFGTSVSLNGDGRILAVGAPEEASATKGLNGDAGDNSAFRSGAVYLFERINGTWQFTDYIKASNTSVGDAFGRSVELSFAGTRLAVGAPCESSSAAGVDGDQEDESRGCAGAVYIYDRSDGHWDQTAYIKSSKPVSNASFGYSLGFDDDADTLAIGAIGETPLRLDSAILEYDACNAGGVYIFRSRDGTWLEETRVLGSNTQGANCDKQGTGDFFGHSVALSGGGDLLVVGAPGESNVATGINSARDNRDDPFAMNGAAYVFSRSNGSWVEEVYVKPSVLGGFFGYSLDVDNTGTRFFVADPGSRATYVFDKDPLDWKEAAKLMVWDRPQTSDPAGHLFFGSSIAASADGSVLVVGSKFEDGTSPGVRPAPETMGNVGFNAGAAFLFRYVNDSWSEETYIKSSDPGDGDNLGFSIDMDETGATIAIGAPGEDGRGSFGTGALHDDGAFRSGATYVY